MLRELNAQEREAVTKYVQSIRGALEAGRRDDVSSGG
jgi:hypothetical protein